MIYIFRMDNILAIWPMYHWLTDIIILIIYIQLACMASIKKNYFSHWQEPIKLITRKGCDLLIKIAWACVSLASTCLDLTPTSSLWPWAYTTFSELGQLWKIYHIQCMLVYLWGTGETFGSLRWLIHYSTPFFYDGCQNWWGLSGMSLELL